MVGVLPEQVILYDKGRSKAMVYTTAYTEQQTYLALKRCMKRHGRRCNARPAIASSLK